MLRYSEAEERLKQSLVIRASCLPMHDYPRRAGDISALRGFHADYGIPPSGFVRRIAWWLKGVRK